MAKEKPTITLDRAKVGEVRRLTGAVSVSAAIDLALRELIRVARLRRDLAAYGAIAVTDDEVAAPKRPAGNRLVAEQQPRGCTARR